MSSQWVTCVNEILLFSLTDKIDYRYASDKIDNTFKSLDDLVLSFATKIEKIYVQNRELLESDDEEDVDEIDEVLSEMCHVIPLTQSMHGDNQDTVKNIFIKYSRKKG